MSSVVPRPRLVLFPSSVVPVGSNSFTAIGRCCCLVLFLHAVVPRPCLVLFPGRVYSVVPRPRLVLFPSGATPLLQLGGGLNERTSVAGTNMGASMQHIPTTQRRLRQPPGGVNHSAQEGSPWPNHFTCMIQKTDQGLQLPT